MEIETKLKSIVAADGSTLYEHLLNTIGKLVQDHPKNAYEAFEEYSDFVKTTKYKYYDTANFRDSSKLRDSWDELAPYITKMREYFVGLFWIFLVSVLSNRVGLCGEKGRGRRGEPRQ